MAGERGQGRSDPPHLAYDEIDVTVGGGAPSDHDLVGIPAALEPDLTVGRLRRSDASGNRTARVRIDECHDVSGANGRRSNRPVQHEVTGSDGRGHPARGDREGSIPMKEGEERGHDQPGQEAVPDPSERDPRRLSEWGKSNAKSTGRGALRGRLGEIDLELRLLRLAGRGCRDRRCSGDG